MLRSTGNEASFGELNPQRLKQQMPKKRQSKEVWSGTRELILASVRVLPGRRLNGAYRPYQERKAGKQRR